MDRTSIWIGVCLLVFGAALVAIGGAVSVGAPRTATFVAVGIVLLVAASVAAFVSRRRRDADPEREADTEPLWPYVTGSPRRELRPSSAYEEADESRAAAWAIGIVLVAAAVGGSALAFFVTRDGDGPQPLDPQEETSAPSATLTAVPTAATSTAVPTSTVSRPSPTASPTPAPARDEPTATPRHQPPATPTPGSRQQVSANVSGQWRITDVVEFGQDSGKTYAFTVTLSQDGRSVRGAGDGLTLEGQLDGDTLRLSYTRSGGSGVFEWTASSSDSFAGQFQDFGAQNGGGSTLVRTR